VPRTIAIPDRIFDDFKVLNQENEPFFQFMAFFATVTFLEKVEDDFWALEFPACISSDGRPFLYKVAAYFRLAYHTQGKAGKNRRTIMYPGSQFKEK
jgi:hypothetical protein